jgi:pyruvate ferredoxin oxidoreductase gamma subunit
MKRDGVEIRWHGRGGQGAKTACLLLADVAFNSGKYVQGFPEYGPERMGAPITAYNRIMDRPGNVHSNIYFPDYVAVVDETLLKTVDVTSGIKEGGALVVNTSKSPDEIRKMLPEDYKESVYCIDAQKVSMETIGKNFPNTPMLAAVVKVSRVIDEQQFIRDMRESFEHKFATKPQVIEGNMKALQVAMKEIIAG